MTWPDRQWQPPTREALGLYDDEGEEHHRRVFRESALQAAIMLHGEAETQAVFRDHEVNEVIEDARRFFDYIWDGPVDAVREDS